MIVFRGFWRLHAGPHACKTSILPTEPSLQPLQFLATLTLCVFKHAYMACIYAHRCSYAMAHMWGSKDNFVESVFFYSRIQGSISAVSFCSKHVYLLNHLAGPLITFEQEDMCFVFVLSCAKYIAHCGDSRCDSVSFAGCFSSLPDVLYCSFLHFLIIYLTLNPCHRVYWETRLLQISL